MLATPAAQAGALDSHSAALTGAARVRQYIRSLAPTDPRLSRGCRPSLRHATASADTGTLPSTCLRPQATFRDQCTNSSGESLRVHAAVATAYTQLGHHKVTLPYCPMQLDSAVDRFVCRGMQRMHNPPDHHGHASRASTPDTCHSSGLVPLTRVGSYRQSPLPRAVPHGTSSRAVRLRSRLHSWFTRPPCSSPPIQSSSRSNR